MISPHVALRTVRPDDLAALREIRNDHTAQAVLLGHPEARGGGDDTADWVARRAHDPTGRFWVVDRAGFCVGFVQLTGRHGIDRHAHFGIALRRDARGGGVGRAAMRELFAIAAAEGLHKLLCEVRADNDPALALYRRLGFRDVGRLEAHYHDGERRWDVVVMERLLGDPNAS